jgi:hypothetical protein
MADITTENTDWLATLLPALGQLGIGMVAGNQQDNSLANLGQSYNKAGMYYGANQMKNLNPMTNNTASNYGTLYNQNLNNYNRALTGNPQLTPQQQMAGNIGAGLLNTNAYKAPYTQANMTVNNALQQLQASGNKGADYYAQQQNWLPYFQQQRSELSGLEGMMDELAKQKVASTFGNTSMGGLAGTPTAGTGYGMTNAEIANALIAPKLGLEQQRNNILGTMGTISSQIWPAAAQASQANQLATANSMGSLAQLIPQFSDQAALSSIYPLLERNYNLENQNYNSQTSALQNAISGIQNSLKDPLAAGMSMMNLGQNAGGNAISGKAGTSSTSPLGTALQTLLGSSSGATLMSGLLGQSGLGGILSKALGLSSGADLSGGIESLSPEDRAIVEAAMQNITPDWTEQYPGSENLDPSYEVPPEDPYIEEFGGYDPFSGYDFGNYDFGNYDFGNYDFGGYTPDFSGYDFGY